MKRAARLYVLVIVFLPTFLIGCGGHSSGTTTPPPTPVPAGAFTANPTSIAQGNSSTLTWSSTNATSVTASGAWSGSKPLSGSESVTPTTTSTYTLQYTGSGGSTFKSATVTVTVPPQVMVAVDPKSTTVEVAQTKQFTRTVTNTTDTAVIWSTTCGTASMGGGTISVSGLFTAARPIGSCTVTATSHADPTKSDSATVTVIDPLYCQGGFSWLKFYAPPGGSAKGKAVVKLPSGMIVVGVDAVRQGTADPVATIVFYRPDGSVEKVLENIELGGIYVPSTIASMVYDPATDNIYVTGYTGTAADPSGHAAMLLGISVSSEQIVLNRTYSAEFGNLKAEARVVSVQNGKIYLAVKSDYENTWDTHGNCPQCHSGDWIVIANMSGNILTKFTVGNWMGVIAGDRTSITGMLVLSDSVWATGDAMDNSGNIYGYYLGHWSLDGTLIDLDLAYVSGRYNTKIIGGLNGDQLVGGTGWYDDPDNQRCISVQQFNIGDVEITGFPVWYGDNSGQLSINKFRDLVLNPDASGGVTAVGTLSKIGAMDLTSSDGGIISWAADRSVFWKKRLVDLPNNWTVSSANGVLYDADGRVIIVGTGSDGTSCAAGSPCPLATTGESCYPAPAW